MPLTPAVNTTVNITVPDINGNSVAKVFSDVSELMFDYVKGVVRVTDVTGQFYFTLLTITTLTYTVISGSGASTHTVVAT